MERIPTARRLDRKRFVLVVLYIFCACLAGVIGAADPIDVIDAKDLLPQVIGLALSFLADLHGSVLAILLYGFGVVLLAAVLRQGRWWLIAGLGLSLMPGLASESIDFLVKAHSRHIVEEGHKVTLLTLDRVETILVISLWFVIPALVVNGLLWVKGWIGTRLRTRTRSE